MNIWNLQKLSLLTAGLLACASCQCEKNKPMTPVVPPAPMEQNVPCSEQDDECYTDENKQASEDEEASTVLPSAASVKEEQPSASTSPAAPASQGEVAPHVKSEMAPKVKEEAAESKEQVAVEVQEENQTAESPIILEAVPAVSEDVVLAE